MLHPRRRGCSRNAVDQSTKIRFGNPRPFYFVQNVDSILSKKYILNEAEIMRASDRSNVAQHSLFVLFFLSSSHALHRKHVPKKSQFNGLFRLVLSPSSIFLNLVSFLKRTENVRNAPLSVSRLTTLQKNFCIFFFLYRYKRRPPFNGYSIAGLKSGSCRKVSVFYYRKNRKLCGFLDVHSAAELPPPPGKPGRGRLY